MKNIFNLLKYDMRKTSIADIIGAMIYILINLGISVILGELIGATISFGMLILILIVSPIAYFCQETSTLTKENALIFSTPIKGSQYLIAKMLRYVIKIIPFVLVFIIQLYLVNKNYLGIIDMIGGFKAIVCIVLIVLLGGMLFFIEALGMFICTKKYLKNIFLNITATIVSLTLMQIILEWSMDIIHMIVPFYYISISGFVIGISEIIIGTMITIIICYVASKVLDSGIDIN